MSKFILAFTLIFLGVFAFTEAGVEGEKNCKDFHNCRQYLKLVRQLYCPKKTGSCAVRCAYDHIGTFQEDGSWESVKRLLKIAKRFFADKKLWKEVKPRFRDCIITEYNRLSKNPGEDECITAGMNFRCLVRTSHEFGCNLDLIEDPSGLFG